MTAKNIGARETPSAVSGRADGEAGEEALAHPHVAAAPAPTGPPPVKGDVRVRRASARHVEPRRSDRTHIRTGSDPAVVHAHEVGAHVLTDRLHDRLRSATVRVAHRGDTTRRTAPPPPGTADREVGATRNPPDLAGSRSRSSLRPSPARACEGEAP